MQRGLLVIWIVCLLVVGSLKRPLPAQAQQSATYQLIQSHIGPGQAGGSGAYSLSSSVGQPDAGQVSVGSYTLGGGFWGGGIIVSVGVHYNVYLPLLIK